jgi:hypothetical protein
MVEDLEIYGTPPDIEGKYIDEIYVQPFCYDGKISDEANVVFIKFEGKWWRLYFDFGMIYWQKTEDAPSVFTYWDEDGTEHHHPVIDIF